MYCAITHFYLAASVQGGLSSDRMSVRPSVRLSVKRANCDKRNFCQHS